MGKALMVITDQAGLSSAHVTFNTEDEWSAMKDLGFLQRTGIQARGKSINRGADLKTHHWDAFYDFYLNTVDKNYAQAYLTLAGSGSKCNGHLCSVGYQDNAPSFKDGTGSIHTSYMAIKRRKCNKCKKVYQDTAAQPSSSNVGQQILFGPPPPPPVVAYPPLDESNSQLLPNYAIEVFIKAVQPRIEEHHLLQATFATHVAKADANFKLDGLGMTTLMSGEGLIMGTWLGTSSLRDLAAGLTAMGLKSQALGKEVAVFYVDNPFHTYKLLQACFPTLGKASSLVTVESDGDMYHGINVMRGQLQGQPSPDQRSF
eukprot:gene10732-17807_t